MRRQEWARGKGDTICGHPCSFCGDICGDGNGTEHVGGASVVYAEEEAFAPFSRLPSCLVSSAICCCIWCCCCCCWCCYCRGICCTSTCNLRLERSCDVNNRCYGLGPTRRRTVLTEKRRLHFHTFPGSSDNDMTAATSATPAASLWAQQRSPSVYLS